MLDLTAVFIISGLILAFIVANRWARWADECDGDARKELDRLREIDRRLDRERDRERRNK